MAKSKVGGTRALLRGRVGSDVYSIGKDAKGEKQQIVRSLAEQVANPQTTSQMRGRMIMSTIMQAVAGMKSLVDHSFDNVAAGQPSISEFIRRNYALIKADVAAHAATANVFGLNKYQEKGVKQGAYVIAAGSAANLQNVVVNGESKTLTITIPSGCTIAQLRTALGIGINDFFTPCAITAAGKFVFLRLHVATDIADDVVLSSSNIADAFTAEGNVTASFAFAATSVTITLADFSANYGIIVSRKQTSGYIHNNVVLVAPTAPAFTADVALQTYPIGTQRFLNGGDEDVVAESNSTTIESGSGSTESGGSNSGGSNGGGDDDPNAGFQN